MATSIHRVITLTFVIKFLIIPLVVMSIAASTYNEGQFSVLDSKTDEDNYLTRLFFEDENPDLNSDYKEESSGNIAVLLGTVWDWMKFGWGTIPIGFAGDDYERRLYGGLNWFIRIINAMVVLEILLLWYTKKNA